MSFNKRLKTKIQDLDNAVRIINGLRLKGKKIVFTNGCFDILHKGHVTLLAKARDLGDILVLGLNTDESVKKQGKGENRPVNDQNARACVLASLEFVDYIVLFNEDTPLELIKTLRPNVLVKGGDYEKEIVVGYSEVKSFGGETVIIPLVEGYSTTSTIEKMKK
ncbi:MAG: D-glycero-beta-D-manno-heptose 1-phosphate adenylyltransferase [Sphingobacteriaceae bacterium]|nr:D-glycero-beta-D-manno-heptose 1-phosphate adenylyltransferase [Sphingobacteriaceae bacterium]